jgi:hypothetical protein
VGRRSLKRECEVDSYFFRTSLTNQCPVLLPNCSDSASQSSLHLLPTNGSEWSSTPAHCSISTPLLMTPLRTKHCLRLSCPWRKERAWDWGDEA